MSLVTVDTKDTQLATRIAEAIAHSEGAHFPTADPYTRILYLEIAFYVLDVIGGKEISYGPPID